MRTASVVQVWSADFENGSQQPRPDLTRQLRVKPWVKSDSG